MKWLLPAGACALIAFGACAVDGYLQAGGPLADGGRDGTTPADGGSSSSSGGGSGGASGGDTGPAGEGGGDTGGMPPNDSGGDSVSSTDGPTDGPGDTGTACDTGAVCMGACCPPSKPVCGGKYCCAPKGNACAGQQDCCPMLFCNGGQTCQTCIADYKPCTQDYECCSNSCNFQPEAGGQVCTHGGGG